ncbi:hypothetical protein PV963_42960 [Streptomyces coeruleorubidus]|uniref:hypothetical protein n=1 Tax=Streptomyces coeruleorubidus TaxID=116188 RepID=UPI00237F9322|nr:hypothetical protein [Streptomyces coeruleorubidus]WDV56608.1 hypothetical protein PV963_42960 [Streptomyces coeruleorubidus]
MKFATADPGIESIDSAFIESYVLVRIYPSLLAMKYPRPKVPPDAITAAIAVVLRLAPTMASTSSDISVTHADVKRMTPMADLLISTSSDSS